MNSSVRVRFAPSPTGIMHLGNVRAALINYLFARQKKGTFILRIEDTDPQRNVDPQGKQIIADLAWLGLQYDEGPLVGGPNEPYFQSERNALYQHHLDELALKDLIYRCFCTEDELEKKRQRQITLKQPPRYDRTCLQLTSQAIEQKLTQKLPHIWRFKLPEKEITVIDLARGNIHYNLKHFSDFPLSRQDGSFTFVFANFVDDLLMSISHVFRGEEHISSTALQAALYDAFNHSYPLFWHFPVICNAQGKKLSKRDFGFSLNDLRKEGFLPEAIVNYLAIIGGSFEQEIMSLEELIPALNFEQNASAGYIRYDVEKLRWVNHQWILRIPSTELAQRCRLLLAARYPQAQSLPQELLIQLLEPIRPELITLADTVEALSFYFEQPQIDPALLELHHINQHKPLIQAAINSHPHNPQALISMLTQECKKADLKPKDLYALLRIALTGKPHGIGMKELLSMLPPDQVMSRLKKIL